MKNMYSHKSAWMAVAALVALASCSEVEAPHETVPEGPFVQLDQINNAVINLNDPSSAYQAVLRAPSGNVASWDVSVSISDGTTTTDLVPLLSVSEFPTEISISAQDIAQAMGQDVSAFDYGNQINFEATTQDIDGNVWTFDDLSLQLATNAGQEQSYRFNSVFSCPFESSAMLGEYRVVAETFEVARNEFVSVTAGPEANQIVIEDLFGYDLEGDDLVLTVDATTGVATLDSTPAWDSGAFGWPYGLVYIDGQGFAFACTGQIRLNVEHRISSGATFGGGPYQIVLQHL